jgi:hypothetical protein
MKSPITTFLPFLPLRLVLLATTMLLAACTHFPEEERVALPEVPQLGRFSQARPGDELPGGWRLWTLSRFKRPTDYELVKDGGHTVVRARAESSASGLVHDVKVDPREFPILAWRWKVDGLIPGADNTESHSEDSPVRVIVSFEGDVSKLDFEERIFATRLRMLTGHQMPYATLMYIWENKAAVGTVIPSRHTSRVRMIVADSGSGRLGAWQDEARNVYEDYRHAFGEEPPLIKSIAIMTDTDNTGEHAHALYGDIVFMRAYPPKPSALLD